MLDLLVTTVAIPDISHTFSGSSLRQLEWVMVCYTLAFGASIQPAGALSDYIGSRRIFLVGLWIMLLTSLGCVLSPNIEVLLAFRFFQGIAAGTMFSAVLPLIARTFPLPQRRGAIALWTGFAAFASVIGPLIGGLAVQIGSWRAMFAINIPLVAFAIIIGARVLSSAPASASPVLEGKQSSEGGSDGMPTTPVADSDDHPDVKTQDQPNGVPQPGPSAPGPDGPPRPSARGFDWWGAGLFAAAVAAVTYLLSGLKSASADPGSLALWGAVSVVLVTLFLVRQVKARSPLLELRLFSRAEFSAICLTAIINRVATFGATIYLMIYLQQELDYSAFVAALFTLPIGIAGVVGARFAARTSLGPWSTIIVGSVSAVVGGTILLSTLWMQAVNAPTLLAGLFVWGLGGIMVNTPLMQLATTAVPPQRIGMATGFVNSLFPLGASLGAVLSGLAYSSNGFFGVIALATVTSVLGAAVATWVVLTGASAYTAAQPAGPSNAQ